MHQGDGHVVLYVVKRGVTVFLALPGLSIPMPKAIVAQITRTLSLIHLSWTSDLETNVNKNKGKPITVPYSVRRLMGSLWANKIVITITMGVHRTF